MTWYVVKLRFATPVHFGSDEAGVGVENVQLLLHSDTIFSALCNIWAKFRILTVRELELLGQSFQGSSAFRMSSAFPYFAKGYGTEFFLPKPVVDTSQFERFRMRPEQRVQWKKQLKQAQFVPSEFFKKWLRAERFIQEGWQDSLDEWRNIYTEEIRPQHAQDRLTMASQLYHLGEIFFEPDPYYDCGLYFVVQFPENESWKEILNKGLKALSDVGLGGEKSTGMGRFLCDGVRYGVLLPIDNRHPLFFLTEDTGQPGKQCLLSLFYPDSSERNTIHAARSESSSSIAYGLVNRKGWTSSTSTLLQMKRQTLRCFTEGSVFGVRNFTPQGAIVDVRPTGFPHPVWRYGLALSVSLAEP